MHGEISSQVVLHSTLGNMKDFSQLPQKEFNHLQPQKFYGSSMCFPKVHCSSFLGSFHSTVTNKEAQEEMFFSRWAPQDRTFQWAYSEGLISGLALLLMNHS